MRHWESPGTLQILCWGPSCKVQGKSWCIPPNRCTNVHSDGVHQYRTAIECKNWKKKVDKDPITKLSAIIVDAQIEKGVIVSQSGFTPDAKGFARSTNIGLVELRDPLDADWEGLIKDIHIDLHIEMPEYYDYEFIQDDLEGKGKLARVQSLTSEVLFRTTDGRSISLHELTNSNPINLGSESPSLTL